VVWAKALRLLQPVLRVAKALRLLPLVPRVAKVLRAKALKLQ
jgi:hypothetical protein